MKYIGLAFFCSSTVLCMGGDEHAVRHRSLDNPDTPVQTVAPYVQQNPFLVQSRENLMRYSVSVPRVHSRRVEISDELAVFCCCEPSMCGLYMIIAAGFGGIVWLNHILDSSAQ